MNPKINLPYKVRASIYIVVLFGTAVIVPLYAGHLISDLVMAVWTSLSGAASGLAAINVTPEDK